MQNTGSALRMKAVLLTGWEPYGGYSANPSKEIALLLDGKRLGNSVVRSVLLPVVFKTAFQVFKTAFQEALDEKNPPDVILSLGLYPFISAIQVERVAINVKDCDGVPDNAGDMPIDEPVVPGGPNALFSTLPIRAIVNNIHEAGIPAIISNSAATHGCNMIMYDILHLISERGWSTRAGFIHLPLLPQQVPVTVLDRHPLTPSLPLEISAKAVEIAIETTLGFT